MLFENCKILRHPHQGRHRSVGILVFHPVQGNAVKAQRVCLEWHGFKVLIGLAEGTERRPSRRQRNPSTMPRYDEASAKSSRLEGRRSVKDGAFFQGTAFPGSYKMFEILLKTVPFGSALLSKLLSTRK